jgi:endonuclease YncB( thermonuclease family)
VRRLITLAGSAGLIAVALLLASCVSRDAFTPPALDTLPVALVVAIHDGDTVSVLRREGSGPREIRIRLSGIDAPERGQAFGDRAKRTLSQLAFRQDVRIWESGQDRYGRTLARLYRAEDGLDLNLELVRRGFAWHYLRFSDEGALAEAEQAARSRRLGLWSDKAPIPPWEYRMLRATESATVGR